MAQAHTNLAGDLLEDVQQPQRVGGGRGPEGLNRA